MYDHRIIINTVLESVGMTLDEFNAAYQSTLDNLEAQEALVYRFRDFLTRGPADLSKVFEPQVKDEQYWASIGTLRLLLGLLVSSETFEQFKADAEATGITGPRRGRKDVG